MKQTLKNEIDILELINKTHALLIMLDKKVDTLIHRSLAETRPSIKPAVDSIRNDRNKERVMHKAICADCKKECSIPFKPSGDRPVYCQDCFSRRKVINLSGMTAPSLQRPTNKEIEIQKSQGKAKKKAVIVKKSMGKKKVVPKKK